MLQVAISRSPQTSRGRARSESQEGFDIKLQLYNWRSDQFGSAEQLKLGGNISTSVPRVIHPRPPTSHDGKQKAEYMLVPTDTVYCNAAALSSSLWRLGSRLVCHQAVRGDAVGHYHWHPIVPSHDGVHRVDLHVANATSRRNASASAQPQTSLRSEARRQAKMCVGSCIGTAA